MSGILTKTPDFGLLIAKESHFEQGGICWSGKPPKKIFTDSCRARIVGFMEKESIPPEYQGWWRITETSQWVNSELDLLGPALISFTGCDDRLRMLALLAYVTCKPTRLGVSFTWEGAWEYDQMSGSGSVKLGKDGRLKGVIKIMSGDDSTFIAERSEEPDEPIPNPPSYRDKWRRRRW